MKLTENFSKSEFECNCGCDMPEDVFLNIQKLANQLQAIRDFVKVGFSPTNAYRCPEHNAKVGGAKRSQHLLGKAADLQIKGYTPDEVADIIERLIGEGNILQGGLGRYNSFTHYDIRKTEARWDKRI